MGAPKQKWTSEEEAALKAGIARYGIGKWSTILKDPEFSGVLRARSNVDLKDKWRNINVMTSGLGSRQRGRPGYKSSQSIPKPDDDALIFGTAIENGPEVLESKTPFGGETLPDASSKKPISRLDELITEAVTKLNEPRGSHRDAIASYINDLYLAPSSFERLLAANLKLLTDNGRLIKVKNQYRIAPSSASLGVSREQNLEDVQVSWSIERNGIKVLTKAQIDAELDQMRNMTAQEAAAAAAQAVAEAEAAIAEAEAAAKEAEEAEAEAEAAQCFAEAAMNALNCRTVTTIRV